MGTKIKRSTRDEKAIAKSASAPDLKKSTGYLHGYTTLEQQRLYDQARVLEHSVYSKVDFSKCNNLIEVGCGVGAQTQILLERFNHLKISAIDLSQAQIKTAKKTLHQAIKKNQVEFSVGNAENLKFKSNSFDGAFLCWFLEHVPNPPKILKEVKRVLKAGGVIMCSEVMNSSLYVHPYSPNLLQYWFEFNDYQWNLGGDPFVGAKLANLLLGAGFQNVETEIKTEFYDNRTPKRRADFIEYWTELLLSGAPGLLKNKRVSQELVDQMKNELQKLKEDPESVFYYHWVQAKGRIF